MELKSIWNFVEKYYPNYYGCNTIAYADDLHKIINSQFNGNAFKLWNTEVKDGGFDRNIDFVMLEYNKVVKEIYEKAISNYINLPKIEGIDKIDVVSDVYRFFTCLSYEGLNFHPDTHFEDYTGEDHKPTYTPEESSVRNRLLDQCFDVCEIVNTDIYDIANKIFEPETYYSQAGI